MQAELPLQESLMHKKGQKFLPLENYLKPHLHTAFYQEHTCGLKKVKKVHTDNISKFGHRKLLYFQD